jgi:ERO1-like protein beta
MYFNAILLLRAVARIGPYLTAYDYCGTGNHDTDPYTHAKLKDVIGIAQHVGRFDERSLFRGPNAEVRLSHDARCVGSQY